MKTRRRLSGTVEDHAFAMTCAIFIVADTRGPEISSYFRNGRIGSPDRPGRQIVLSLETRDYPSYESEIATTQPSEDTLIDEIAFESFESRMMLPNR